MESQPTNAPYRNTLGVAHYRVGEWHAAIEALMKAEELAQRFGGSCVEVPVLAFERAKKLAGKRGLVVVAGSIFVMAAVRAHLLDLPSDPPLAM